MGTFLVQKNIFIDSINLECSTGISESLLIFILLFLKFFSKVGSGIFIITHISLGLSLKSTG